MANRDRGDRILTDWNLVFDALADPSRRYVLEYLHDRSVPVSVWELAIALAVRTTDRPPNQVDIQVVEQAETGIVHVHLPKLEAANLVKSNGETLELTDHAETLPLFTPAYRGIVRPLESEERSDWEP
ncbi:MULTISPECIES: helix-turn-helix domain-containing protein [Haloferax]|uniref:ArsR family transcriptional regulator n=2 Tax=Haloferax TaxID=2251 RepID=A0A6G1YZX7_9EURY|nr:MULTISPECIES: helix-turn-helix domain-containing protein [Haloferax]KAB1186964.1 helix-turn-helix transcriptional regulator [Haloferax sp. CBA1149]MRW79594.1 ArsR family transcriptional regulator [Haloferax marinisediminis]